MGVGSDSITNEQLLAAHENDVQTFKKMDGASSEHGEVKENEFLQFLCDMEAEKNTTKAGKGTTYAYNLLYKLRRNAALNDNE